MRKSSLLILILVLVLVLILIPISVSAASLKEVLAKPDSFDRKEVVVEAEAIGELLKTDSGHWLNVSFEGYNLGVFTQNSRNLRDIKYWGSYLETGDYLKITGTFYKDCPLHQMSDIHLESLEVLDQGHKNQQTVSPKKVRLANLGLAFCLVIAIIYFIKEKYGKRS